MLYFDNAATTWPKPAEVKSAVFSALIYYGANPGDQTPYNRLFCRFALPP